MSGVYPSQRPEPRMPGPELRVILTLAILVHLVALATAMAAYPQPSLFLAALRNVFAPYTQSLKIDVVPPYYGGARWHLTHAGESDVDYSIVVEGKLPSGKTEKATFPSARGWPLISWKRQQTLADAAGSLTEDENRHGDLGLLLSPIAGDLLRQMGATDGKVTVRKHLLASIENMNSPNRAESDPSAAAYFETPYEATVLFQGDQVELLKTSSKGEVAPTAPGRKAR